MTRSDGDDHANDGEKGNTPNRQWTKKLVRFLFYNADGEV